MKATLKPREMKGESKMNFYRSWAEQMFVDKLAQYHVTTLEVTFEVEKESEKAVQLKVPTESLYYINSGEEYVATKPYWLIWMPKSAVIMEEA